MDLHNLRLYLKYLNAAQNTSLRCIVSHRYSPQPVQQQSQQVPRNSMVSMPKTTDFPIMRLRKSVRTRWYWGS